MNVKLLTTTLNILDMEANAALAALTCHGNTEKAYVPSEVLKNIIKLGHESILEHINLTFSVEGLSRACLQELSRHRHISLSVESTRHTLREHINHEEIKAVSQLVDCSIGLSDKDKHRWSFFKTFAHFALLHPDMSNDELKYFIPDFWTTNLIITLNVREFRHILKLRTAPDALKEFRDLARSMFNEVPEQFKYLVQDCVHEEVKA